MSYAVDANVDAKSCCGRVMTKSIAELKHAKPSSLRICSGKLLLLQLLRREFAVTSMASYPRSIPSYKPLSTCVHPKQAADQVKHGSRMWAPV